MKDVSVGIALGGDVPKVLVGERVSAGVRYREFPGGHCEPGESVVSALNREWREETGLLPPAWRILQKASYGQRRIHFFEGWYLAQPAPWDQPVMGCTGQSWYWLEVSGLVPQEFWPANEAVIRSVQSRYLMV